MELKEVETLARSLMTAHGVGSLHFGFDNARRRLGQHTFQRFESGLCVPKGITLSRHYAVLLGEDEIREVILHEIAHALTPGRGHDAVWRVTARKIGAKGTRCVSPSATPDKRVTADCPVCGEKLAAQHRLPLCLYVCKSHRRTPLTWYRDGVKVAPADMPQKYRQRIHSAVLKGLIDGR